ncbi:MAG: tetratricopeptide repeat protein, partial [Candidatus Heimdallarchaeota archaeon]|nr:tetratricopeptide repeat protein [Candidatus Heimdallarchaeota archaeon]
GTLRAQGDLKGARKIQGRVLEITRRVLGVEHPSTSVTAWNLLNTLIEMSDMNKAMNIMEKHLRWLLGRDPESLGADQRQIRELIIQMFQGARLHE